MPAVVVDASVWVGRYLEQDANHLVSYQWLKGHFRAGGVVIAPMILLAELAGWVARRTGDRELAHKSYQHLLELPNFRVVPDDRLLGSVAAKLAADLALRGADAVYVALAQTLGLTLVTWDVQQRERGARAVSIAVPAV